MRNAVINVTLAIAAAIPCSAAIIQAQTQSSKSSVGNSSTAGNETTATIVISGMSCGSCAMQIQSTLEKTPGVKSADVSYEKKRAVVSYDAKTTSVETIRIAIEALGYQTGKSKENEAKPLAALNDLAKLSISKLKEEFNRSSEKVRVLAILSPTCDACQRGRGVVAEMFDQQKSEKLAGFVVWLPMKPRDSAETAWLESEKLKDERISVRGWDGNRVIGKLFAKPLKLSSTAWDVYLVYAAGVKWEGSEPPQPSYWMHQLQGQRADTTLCLNPTALSSRVQKFLEGGK